MNEYLLEKSVMLKEYLGSKIIFYCINPSYPMDNCFTGRRRWVPPNARKGRPVLSTGRTGRVVCIREVAHHTFFLSTQLDITASFSFGACLQFLKLEISRILKPIFT